MAWFILLAVGSTALGCDTSKDTAGDISDQHDGEGETDADIADTPESDSDATDTADTSSSPDADMAETEDTPDLIGIDLGDTSDIAEPALSLTATFGPVSTDFERAYYGLTSPANATSGEWEIYVEAYAGGDPGCPGESSPTPDRTLIVSGMLAPPASMPAPRGLLGVLFDFEGLLTTEPLLRSDSASGTLTDADVCTDACVSLPPPRDPDGFVRLDVDLDFPGGKITGQIYATHCDSLDAVGP